MLSVNKRNLKVIVALIILVFVLFLLDVANVINPQRYLVKYSSQGVESISYYRVKLALILGADPNVDDEILGSSIYGAYITEREDILTLLMPRTNCKKLELILESSIHNKLYYLAEEEMRRKCLSDK